MFRRFNQDQVFTACILFLGAVLLAFSGLLIRFDYILYDASQFLSFKNPPKDIVIVAIDERSLDTIGKWPWRREIHTKLLKTISLEQPRAIGIDVFFSEPDHQNPQGDRDLANIINAHHNFILPVVIDLPFQNAKIAQHFGLPSFNHARVGRVNVPLDGDGIARGIYLWEAVSASGQPILGIPHFSYAVLNVAKQLPKTLTQPAPVLLSSNHEQQFFSHHVWQQEKKIRFYGKPGHFQQISFSSVLAGDFPKNFFNNKIVLVGATAVGMGDVLSTPVSGYSKPMAGVEFHANAIETMRQNQLVTIVPRWFTVIICGLLAIIPVFWLPRLKPLQSLLMILLYLLFLIILMMLLPIFSQYWAPSISAVLMTLLAYPIWSLRRLERTQTFLNAALVQLNDDLQQFGLGADYLNEFKNNGSADVFQTRILQVKNATQLLRELHKNRDDTLSFISHDIRAPLSTALILLRAQDFMQHKETVMNMLDRANRLAEHFLQISRVKAISATQFKALELNGLMQEVVDNAFYLASAKKIKIALTVDENPIWVNGEFSLLQRAFENIVLNAVKFSPENTQINISVLRHHQQAFVKIEDQGCGIAADKIPQLFNQFSRLEADETLTQGSGLGLYFVHLTVKKHAGKIEVKSVFGQSTSFIVTLLQTG